VNCDVETAAAIAEELAPATGFLDLAIAAAVDGGSRAGDDDDAVPIAEGGGIATFAVAAGGDFGVGPDGGGEGGEFVGLGKGRAAGEKDADVGGPGGKRTQEGPEVRILDETVVGGGEAAPVEEGGLTVGGDPEGDPVGLGAAAFDAKDVVRCGSGRHGRDYTPMKGKEEGIRLIGASDSSPVGMERKAEGR